MQARASGFNRFWTSDTPLDVRLWLEADIHPHSDLRPLHPRKQTSRWVPLYVAMLLNKLFGGTVDIEV